MGDTKRPAGHDRGSRGTRRADAPPDEAHATPVPVPQPVQAEPRTDEPIPVVGIGASAGGLEALEQFLRHAPPDAGIAFVVVQHLDPDHKGALVELLQRATAMPVVQVEDGQDVEADRVHVIPPGMEMSLLHGRLHLLPLSQPRGLNLPIDCFFRSLAADREQRSIGVVLSGMGSDGTLGLRAIKEKAGAAFVQSPTSATFTGMPGSAIAAGVADVVAPVEELPGRIVAFLRHAPYFSPRRDDVAESQPGALEKALVVLRAQTGNDFSLYKRSTVQRRIERRMGLHQIGRISGYVRHLRENPAEVALLFKELLIGVTTFFRDPGTWDQLRDTVLAELLPAREKGGVVRVWVPACSTGEEAYSLAMVFRQAIEQFQSTRNITVQIYATDLDKDAVDHARLGLYPSNVAADVPAEHLRFFVQEDDKYRVRKEIREMVVFAPQNVLTDPPFTRIDVLSCRNLLIYLSPELQKRVIQLFHYALNPGGFLFLGPAETVGSLSALFAELGGKGRLYRRLEGTADQALAFPRSVAQPVEGTGPRQERAAATAGPGSLEAVATRLIVERFSPPAVLTTETGDILYVSARTGQYLEPAVGKANLNIFAMAREGLRAGLSQAFDAALAQDGPVTTRRVKVQTNGAVHTVDVTVQRLREPKELRGTVMIVIAEVAPVRSTRRSSAKSVPSDDDQRLAALEHELQRARAECQTIREEMRSSQEELTSTNEELQSANEELTTSKEEMQSMNEELQTVNFELQSKVNELSRSNNDVGVLLNGTDIATLFLDNELRIRRFTPKITGIIRLIPSDMGRPISDIAGDLHYPELTDDAREVLRTLVVKERQVPARDGRWFAARIMPYRTVDNVIDGVVITLLDITSSAQLLEATLREQGSQLRQMAESLPSLVWGFRPDGACDYLSRRWHDYTGVSEADHLGFAWLEQVHEADRERVREEWRASVLSGTDWNTEFRLRAKDGVFRWFRTRSVPIRNEDGKTARWYATSTDVDDLKEAARARERAADRLAAILDGIEEPFFALDDDLIVTHLNTAAERTFERSREEVLGKRFADAFPRAVGSTLERELGRHARDRITTSFRADFEHAGRVSRYDVRLHPHATGIAIFLRPGDGGDQ